MKKTFKTALLFFACSLQFSTMSNAQDGLGIDVKYATEHQMAGFMQALNAIKLPDLEKNDASLTAYKKYFHPPASKANDEGALYLVGYRDDLSVSLQSKLLDEKEYRAVCAMDGAPGKALSADALRIRSYYLGLFQHLGIVLKHDHDSSGGCSPYPLNSYVADALADRLTPAMLSFLKHATIYDGKLNSEYAPTDLSPKEAVDEAVFWYGFNKANPGFVMPDLVDRYTEGYSKLLLDGRPDYLPLKKDEKLQPFFREAYAYLLQKYPAAGFTMAHKATIMRLQQQ